MWHAPQNKISLRTCQEAEKIKGLELWLLTSIRRPSPFRIRIEYDQERVFKSDGITWWMATIASPGR